MKSPAILLKGVSKKFGKKQALQNINLEIQPGQKVAVLGPTGSGKTTLLKICAGMEVPDSGSVELFGNMPGGLYRRQLSSMVGLMSQNLDLIEDLRAIHNIQAGHFGRWGFWQGLAALALPIESVSIGNIARSLGIESAVYQQTSSLSGGEKQRVAFARLLVQNPMLMLADEPVSSVDPVRAENMLAMFPAERSCLLSLHSPSLAKKFADKIIGLRDGKIIFNKPAEWISSRDTNQLYELSL